jgi:serine protease Do
MLTKALRGIFLAAAVFAAVAAGGLTGTQAHAQTMLTIDESEGNVQGWRVGYSRGLAGCLAYSRFTDQTTVWFGYSVSQEYFIALTNPGWGALQSGTNYRLNVKMVGQGDWNGSFLAFERAGEKGVFISKLKRTFIQQFALAQAFRIFASGTRMAGVSLKGSKAGLEAVERCFEDRRFQARRDAEIAARRHAAVPPRRPVPPQTGGQQPGGAGGGGNYQGQREPVSAPPGQQPPREPEARTSSGTGFFVSRQGHVVTNEHVVKQCTDIKVGYSGGLLEKASLLATDKRNDLALLKTDLRGDVVPGLKQRVRVGDNIYVYGFPLSGLLSKTGNFTVGYITSAAGLNDDSSQFQISAPVQPGNSGGPLVDRHGNVVGVIVSKLNVLRVAKFIKDVPQNVNFAIKASIAASFLEANGVDVPSELSNETLEPADIADRAKKYTLRIVCARN